MRYFERTASNQKEFKCWSSLRSIISLMIPCCGCNQSLGSCMENPLELLSHSIPSKVIGTIFGHRKGHVYLCIQEDPLHLPLMVLEFSTPRPLLAKEMEEDQLHIVLECEKTKEFGGSHLYSEALWTMSCNGRNVGYAIQKSNQLCCNDVRTRELMMSVKMGAGILPVNEGEASHGNNEDDIVYMRAYFERVVVSADSQAFHMINPDSFSQQELSIFLVRD
ncbi:hypothetical protein SUGI_0074400 [Cryptomeria japonica]|nr:hypothetical protein SUGI_0074400 [Cryptomeria japonica]